MQDNYDSGAPASGPRGGRWFTQLTIERGTDEVQYRRTGLYDGDLAEQIVLREGELTELFIEWRPCKARGGAVFPEVAVHGLSWRVFADWQPLLDAFGRLNEDGLTPEAVIRLALENGFRNASPKR